MKKTLKIIGISLLILILFKGSIFRLSIKYHAIGTRPEIEIIDKTIIDKIDQHAADSEMSLTTISKTADQLTKSALTFRMYETSSNPNHLIYTKEANCVGYSAMYNSIANYLIRKHNLEGDIIAKHKVGKLYFFGFDIHKLFDDSFFKDHDYNEMLDRKTGNKISIDPSVSDYFWISSIAIRQVSNQKN